MQSDFSAKDKCELLYIMYITWYMILIIFFVLRVICIYLSYKAYRYTKLQWENEETKKRRKLRYL